MAQVEKIQAINAVSGMRNIYVIWFRHHEQSLDFIYNNTRPIRICTRETSISVSQYWAIPLQEGNLEKEMAIHFPDNSPSDFPKVAFPLRKVAGKVASID